MKHKNLKRVIFLCLSLLTGLQSSDWKSSITGAIESKSGNTQLETYSIAVKSEYEGDLIFSHFKLLDTEISISLNHNNGNLDGKLYENDGGISFIFDLQAHKTFSPFFLSHWEYDSVTSLESRTQIGFGAKYVIWDGISISLAFLGEAEDYVGEALDKQFRWSLRPKYKKTFQSGLKVNYMLFYKPLSNDFDNYLIEQYLTLLIATKIDWLNISITAQEKYNSQPPSGTEPRDIDTSVGITLTF